MASETHRLAFERTVSAPPAEVYRAFTNAATLRGWLCNDARVEAREGGRLSLWWNDGSSVSGTFTRLAPGEQLIFTWHGLGEPAPTQVQVALAPHAGGTLVSVIHSGLGAAGERSETGTRRESGWPTYLENLQSLLETGVDLRDTRRPMLGIEDAEVLTPELAARLGVPASAGIVVGGVVAGMGLEGAGLRKDDVIVSLDGKPLPDWPRLIDVLQAHQAGDRLPIVFFRGGEQQTAVVHLSSRPRPPEPPSTAAELAEAVRSQYAQLSAELAECFAGVSEQAAAFRAGPDGWSAKEAVAHLIACERDIQSWIAGMLLDVENEDNLAGRPNALPRLAALVSVYDSIPALLDEFRRSADETIALLAALPDEFVERKHLYRRASEWPIANVQHCRAHFEQIRAAITAARG